MPGGYPEKIEPPAPSARRPGLTGHPFSTTRATPGTLRGGLCQAAGAARCRRRFRGGGAHQGKMRGPSPFPPSLIHCKPTGCFTAPPFWACAARRPRACRWPLAAMARSRSAPSSSRARPARCASCTTARCWRVSPAPPPPPADAFTLFERFEAKLDKHQGHLVRSAIELTKDWRTDRVLRRLEAMLAVADQESSLIITGNGDVLEPEQGIIAIGSGGAYANAAAKALLNHTDLSAADIVKQALEIAAELCIYTNMHHTIETL